MMSYHQTASLQNCHLCCACHCVMLLSLCCSVVIMLYYYCVALLLFVLSYVLIVCTVPLPPGVNPIAFDKYIYLSIYLDHCNVAHYKLDHSHKDNSSIQSHIKVIRSK